MTPAMTDRDIIFEPAPQRAYRINEAAKLARVSTRMIYKLIAAGKLETFRIGRCRLVRASSLGALMMEKEVP